MKKKLFIILFVLILIVFIGSKFKIKSPIKKEVKYNEVVEVQENQMSSKKADDFEENASKIGFEESKCSNNVCTATTQQDTTSEYVEIDMPRGKDKELYSVFTSSKDDFEIEKVTEKLNTIINNYYGYTFTSSYIENQLNKLKETSGYGTEDIGVTDYIENGKYVIMFNIEYYEEYYTIRICVVSPESAEQLKEVYK